MKEGLSKKTYAILGLASLVIVVLGLLVKFLFLGFLEIDSGNGDKGNREAHELVFLIFGIGFLVYIITLFIFNVLPNKVVKSTNLYILFTIVAVVIFSIINLTGGLTNSPFTSLYGALMTLTLLIYEHRKAVFFSASVIIVFIAINVTLQNMNMVNTIDTGTSIYRVLYGIITGLLLIFIGTVDYLSKNVQNIPWLKNYFAKNTTSDE